MTTQFRNMLGVTADQSTPAASSASVGTAVLGFSQFKALTFVATIIAVGGTVDMLVEQSADGTNWYEFVHFTQVASGNTKTFVFATALSVATNTNVGKNNATGSTLGTTMVLAAGSGCGGPWMDQMRVRYVTGSGQSATAGQLLSVICMPEAS